MKTPYRFNTEISKNKTKQNKKNTFFNILRGNCTPNQKLVCFVLYLRITNTFLKNNAYI